jgi:hypothetical protein
VIRLADFGKLIHLEGSKSNRKSDEVIVTKADGVGACESIETMAPRTSIFLRQMGFSIIRGKLFTKHESFRVLKTHLVLFYPTCTRYSLAY